MGVNYMQSEKSPKKRSLGISILDSLLGGGVPSGSLICFMAEPMSMAEVFLYQFTSANHTYYFAADRSPSQVSKSISNIGLDTKNIEFIDIYSYLNSHKYEIENDEYPTMKQNLNEISYRNAIKSTNLFIKSVNLPEDMFWKFEFWTEDKIIKILGDLFAKVYSQMMKTDEHSNLRIIGGNSQKMQFTVQFDGCNECKNLKSNAEGVCYYHAGMFAGILSSLLKKKFDAYESECQAKGNDSCIFVIGQKDDAEIIANVAKYLRPDFKSSTEEALLHFEQYLHDIEVVESSGRDFSVIIDSFSFFLELSSDTEYLRKLLNSLYEMTNKTGALTYIYLFKNTHNKNIENMILNKCDVVFDVELTLTNDKISNMFSVLKIRGMNVPTERIKVTIDERVKFDMSTEIA